MILHEISPSALSAKGLFRQAVTAYEAVSFLSIKLSFGYLTENMFVQIVRYDDFIENASDSLTEQTFCGRIIYTNKCMEGRSYGTSVYVY